MVTLLSCTSLKREQVHGHILVAYLEVTVLMDVPEMVPMDDSGPVRLHTPEGSQPQTESVKGASCLCRCP